MTQQFTRSTPAIVLGVMILAGCGSVSHAPRQGEPAPGTVSPQARSRTNPKASSKPLTAAGLPHAFPRYSLVVGTVGRLLARSSTVPVYLPQLGRHPYPRWMDVRYALKNGYQLTLGGGTALPANSPKISIGNAEFIYTIMGTPWTPSFHARTLYLPVHPTPTTSQNGTVTLAPGITGRSYPAAQPAIPVLQSTMLITWREDGWTMNLYGVGLSSQDVVSSARQVATSLRSAHLPGTHGRATFEMGSDAPSIATYEWRGTRYVIEAPGFRAVELAEKMCPIKG